MKTRIQYAALTLLFNTHKIIFVAVFMFFTTCILIGSCSSVNDRQVPQDQTGRVREISRQGYEGLGVFRIIELDSIEYIVVEKREGVSITRHRDLRTGKGRY